MHTESLIPAADVASIERLSPQRPSAFPDEWYGISSVRHFWFEWRLRATLALVDSIGVGRDLPLRVLDVGGGSGLLRDQLEAATKWTVDLVDLNAHALRQARPGRGRILYYDVTQREAVFEGAYDVALLFDVLEHVDETAALLAAIAFHVRRGGTLLVNVPACPALFSAYDRAAGHLRRYHKASLQAELAGLEYELISLRAWGLGLLPLAVLRKLLLGGVPNADTIRRGFSAGSSWAHTALRGLMRLETAVSPLAAMGTSLLLAARRA